MGSAAIASGGGAAAGAVGSMARQYAANASIDWGKVGTAAWHGAVVGAAAGATSGLTRSAYFTFVKAPQAQTFRQVLSAGWIGKLSPQTGWMQLIGPPLGGTVSTILRTTGAF